MHRVDAPGHVAGQYSDGNPAIGQQATQVREAWLNDVQENLCQFIEGTGIPLVKGDGNQLTEAVDAYLALKFNKLLAGSGYQKLSSGLLVQWGSGTQPDNSGLTVITFPITFPTAMFKAWATNAAGSPPVAFHGTGTGTQTMINVYSATATTVAALAGTSFNWLAIGH